MAIDKVLEQALALDFKERAELASALLRSLEPDDGEVLTDDEWNAAWAAELERRAKDLDEGRATTVSFEEFKTRIRSEIRRT